MKTVTIVVLVAVLSATCMAATSRETLYRQFGPMLTEAVVLVIKDEINLLRAEHGLPARTNQQVMDAVEGKLDNMDIPEWMKEVSE